MVVQEYFDKWGQSQQGHGWICKFPRWDVPGMAGMRLDPRGKLRWFRAVPPAIERPADPSQIAGAESPATGSVRTCR